MLRSTLRSVAAPILSGALAVTTVLVPLSTGCFYDSTWGAKKTAQLHNAARATPASLGSSSEAPEASASRAAASDAPNASALRVRVHTSPSYAAQTPDWKAHVGAILAQASVTLQASIGATLVLADAVEWDHPAAARLDVDLAALREEDTGDGVELVLGLVGGLPVASQDFEQVGYSEIRGKHLVVRAPNVASEYDAVEKAFDELSAEQRTRLRRERLRHREVAVLLHEIGHSLGAQHATSAGSLMRPAYDPKMAAFDDVALGEMKRELARRTGAATDKADVAASPSSSPSAPPAPVASAEVAAEKDGPPEDLTPDDRALWTNAQAATKSGNAKVAWETASPLFARYPRVYAVQDLRCKLAMAYRGSFDEVRAECDPLMKLSLEKPNAK